MVWLVGGLGGACILPEGKKEVLAQCKEIVLCFLLHHCRSGTCYGKTTGFFEVTQRRPFRGWPV